MPVLRYGLVYNFFIFFKIFIIYVKFHFGTVIVYDFKFFYIFLISS